MMYPNWWAPIPMPVASFLEEYDFEGKTIMPLDVSAWLETNHVNKK